MRSYLARRLVLVIPTVLGVTMIIFVAMRLLPGDPLAAIFGLERARRMPPGGPCILAPVLADGV